MSDEAILIGGSSGVAGSKQYKCAECDVDVWIAPSGQRTLATYLFPMRILCFICGLLSIASNPDPKIQPIQAEQLREIEQHLRRN